MKRTQTGETTESSIVQQIVYAYTKSPETGPDIYWWEKYAGIPNPLK